MSRETEEARVAASAEACLRMPAPPAAAAGARLEPNPTLQALSLSWRHLAGPAAPAGRAPTAPEPGEDTVLLWREPGSGELRARSAEREDLLALKIVVEGIDPAEAARAGGLPPATVEQVLWQAVDAGLLLAPPSGITRSEGFPRGEIRDERFLASRWFTIQWHITQACDLHCAHCYDRSAIGTLPPDRALAILDDLRDFCRERWVRGQVSFSGGNPFLHPRFLDLYRHAAAQGFALNILGNPVPEEQVRRVLEVAPPNFFQVSLEGLPAHNDRVRGPGHFARSLEFLGTLKRLGVPTMVMLTLTADNVSQVVPLTRELRGLVDDFHFNRLASLGEGASLRLPGRDAYRRFLDEYLEAAESDPALGIKDNLINIVRLRRGLPPFGGCTGFGCGAAFNFLAVLPDGEAHACRKLPSPVGNVAERGIAAVYDSDAVRRYREGTAACRACRIRPVCGGCLAVARGCGLDIFTDRDPLCFIDET